MGKPIKESIAEVDKTMTLIDYYSENTLRFIENEVIKTKYPEAYVMNQPLGPTLCKFFE